jgi:hypothetical protein
MVATPWVTIHHKEAGPMAHVRVLGIDIAKQIWLLARFGEMGSFRGLAPFPCPEESMENCAVIEVKFLHFPH